MIPQLADFSEASSRHAWHADYSCSLIQNTLETCTHLVMFSFFLQAKSVSAAHAMGGETDAELQRGCQAIMSAALAHVQALVTARETLQQPAAVAKTPSKSAKSKAAAAASTPAPLSGSALRKAERAAQVSIESVYGLFAALQGVMDSASYLLVRRECVGMLCLVMDETWHTIPHPLSSLLTCVRACACEFLPWTGR